MMKGIKVMKATDICTISVNSVTYAMIAQGILKNAQIKSRITRPNISASHGGCAYGIEVYCSDSEYAMQLLEAAGVKARLTR